MTQAFPAERWVRKANLLHRDPADGGAPRFLPQCSIPRNMDGFRRISVKLMTLGASRKRFLRQKRGASWKRVPVRPSTPIRPQHRASTTPRTSTMRAASASSRTSRAARRTRSSRRACRILENLTHRGATGADPLQGDGAGILLQMPDAFLRRACGKLGITLPAIGQYGVGMVFLPQEPASRVACEQEIERTITAEGQVLLGWRDVPTNNAGLSEAHEGGRADHPPGVRRPRLARHGSGRARAQALRHPQGVPATRSRR